MAECFSGTDNCIAAVVETKEDVNHHHTSFPMEPNGPLSPSISGLSLNGSSLVPSVANATNTDESVPAPSVDEQQLQTIQRRRRRRRATVPGAASVVEVDPLLLERVMAASHLPNAYAFEIVKTVQRIVALQCTHVALQLPEGLVRYATAIADVLLALTASVSTATVATTRATDDSAAPTPVVHLLKHVSVLADVTYGACCVDDIGAAALQCQLLVHYGHSCLVPLQHTVIPVLYVFVEIQMDANHVGDCLLATIQDQNEEPQQQPLLLLTRDHEEALTATPDPATTMTATTTVEPLLRSAGLEKDLPDVTFGATRTDAESATFLKPTPASPNSPTSSLPNHPGNANHHHHQQQQQEPPLHVYLLGTVQFRHALTAVRDRLTSSSSGASMTVSIPQCHPLSPGEVLGCTSPILKDHLLSSSSNNDNTTDHRRRRAIVCFVADGRFHLESTMLSHASTIDAFYRYDPYTEVLSEEIYDHPSMATLRLAAIEAATTAETFGIILGTLGRQGNPAIVQRLQNVLRKAGRRHFVLLLSEITPAKLQLFATNTNAWVQVACPRLSVDWGHLLGSNVAGKPPIPVLSPYELFVCLEPSTPWRENYPMDYYSTNGGPWSNYYETNKDRQWQKSDKS